MPSKSKKISVKKAVILLAGREKKLAPLTDEIHQCLFNLGDLCVIEDMLLKLHRQGIEEAVLVVGHKSELIKNKIGIRYNNVVIRYVENKDFETTGVAHSLWLAKGHLQDNFLLLDGDIICEEELLETILDTEAEDIIAIDEYKDGAENRVSVKIVKDKVVKIGKDLLVNKDATFAHAIGITKFSAKTASLLIKELDKYNKNKELNKIYEDALNQILDKVDFYPLDVKGQNWFEIDELNEFDKAQKLFGDAHNLKQKAFEYGADKVFNILPTDLIFDDRAIYQCMNCKNYGHKRTCPPFVSRFDYQKMILKYKKGLMVLVKFDSSVDFERARMDSTNKLHRILLKLEKDGFNQDNHFTTSFIGGSCKLCKEGCADVCRNPQHSRIPLESTGVDVVETMKKFGIELKFPATDTIYRVGLLVVG